MARYTFNTNESRIVTSWLYEPSGYLDQAVNASGVSARQALAQNANLDVTQWIRTNTKGSGTAQSDWDECAMVWWMRASSGVNITSQNVPAEKAAWIATLTEWDVSITAAFDRASEAIRNGQTVTLATATGGTLRSHCPSHSRGPPRCLSARQADRPLGTRRASASTGGRTMSETKAPAGGEPEVHRLKELLAFQDGAIVSRVLAKNSGGNVTLFAFDTGEGLSEHTAPFDALVVGVEGRADITIAGVRYAVGEGEMLVLPANRPHAVRAESPFKMLLVMLRARGEATAR